MPVTTTNRRAPIKPKSVVLIEMPEKLKLSLRQLGRPCPHCGRPLTYKKAIDKSNAWYKCEGWTDPTNSQRYAGCENTCKLKKLDPAEMIALIDAGRLGELREYLVGINPETTAEALQKAAQELRSQLVPNNTDDQERSSLQDDEPPVMIDGEEYQPLPKPNPKKKTR